jgi:hypothetical protein
MKAIEGGIVTESAIIEDRQGNSREIDVLIEIESFGHRLKIAVECRDRSRQDDIQWIDELIGKYNNIDIDKIITVSSSGFTQGAINKAIFHGIETITLKEFEETNWPEKIDKIKIGEFCLTLNFVSVSLTVSPVSDKGMEKYWIVCSEYGDKLGTVENVIKHILDTKVNIMAKNYFDKEYMPHVKSMEELRRKIEINVAISIDNMYVEDPDGTKYKIVKMEYIVAGTPVIEEKDIKRYAYGNKAIVSRACIEGDGIRHKIDVIQIVGSPNVTLSHVKGII